MPQWNATHSEPRLHREKGSQINLSNQKMFLSINNDLNSIKNKKYNLILKGVTSGWEYVTQSHKNLLGTAIRCRKVQVPYGLNWGSHLRGEVLSWPVRNGLKETEGKRQRSKDLQDRGAIYLLSHQITTWRSNPPKRAQRKKSGLFTKKRKFSKKPGLKLLSGQCSLH